MASSSAVSKDAPEGTATGGGAEPAEGRTLKNGSRFETVFSLNSVANGFRFMARTVDGDTNTKNILSDDPRIRVGRPCVVRVISIKKPKSKNHGFVEVKYAGEPPLRFDDDFYVDPAIGRRLDALLSLGFNILLDGPQGSGKTVLAKKIAKIRGWVYVYFSSTAVFDSYDFLATFHLRATAGASHSVWLPTAVLDALEAAHENPDKHYLIFIDEFNRCREMARNGILPALDATRKMFNPATGTFIDIPENVSWIAAVNNGAQYTGTTTVDPAQLDRFAPVKMDYPPEEAEREILAKRYPRVQSSQVARVVKAAAAVRRDEHLGLDLSVRATQEACELLAHPSYCDCREDVLPEILKGSFCGRFAGTWNDATTEAGMVWGVVVRALQL